MRTKSGRIVVFLEADAKANEQLTQVVIEALKYTDREITIRPYPGTKYKTVKDKNVFFDTDSSINRKRSISSIFQA
jgi:hypothetical protein